MTDQPEPRRTSGLPNEDVERRAGEIDRRHEGNEWLRELIQGLINEHHRHVRKMATSMAVGYLILLVGTAVGLYFLEHNDNRQQDRSALASCDRVNKLRTQANEIAEAAWATVYISASREQRLANTSTSSSQKKIHEHSAAGLSFIASQFRHTDMTDCHAAVYHSDTYSSPQPQDFDPTSSNVLKNLIRLVGVPL